MKYLSILALILLCFSACIKEATDPGPIVEPPVQILISADTIKTGGQWGLTIGQSGKDAYNTIQQIKTDKGITGLWVVGNIYTNIDSLKTRLPLYTLLFMDDEKGSATGVQLSFENGKVKAMFNNNGDKLTGWPYDTDKSTTIFIGDAVSDIYPKLVKIKQKSALANKLQRLSIFSKDITNGYDPQMGTLPQWSFVSPISATRYNRIALNFSGGKLLSIYSTVYESM